MVGGSLEMEKIDGSVATFPAQDVVAILPQPPEGGGPYSLDQADQAIRLLERTPPDLIRQVGMEGTLTSEWEKFRHRLREEKKQRDELKG